MAPSLGPAAHPSWLESPRQGGGSTTLSRNDLVWGGWFPPPLPRPPPSPLPRRLAGAAVLTKVNGEGDGKNAPFPWQPEGSRGALGSRCGFQGRKGSLEKQQGPGPCPVHMAGVVLGLDTAWLGAGRSGVRPPPRNGRWGRRLGKHQKCSCDSYRLGRSILAPREQKTDAGALSPPKLTPGCPFPANPMGQLGRGPAADVGSRAPGSKMGFV